MKVLTWLVAAVIVLGVACSIWIGPGRLYGWMRSKEIIGTLSRLQPYSAEASPTKTSFIVEVTAQDNTIYTFVSADARWGVMTKGEFLKLRLYPAPPWAGDGEAWSGARVLLKLSELPPAPGISNAVGTAAAGNSTPPSPTPAVPGGNPSSVAIPPLPTDAERYLVRTVQAGNETKIYLLPTPGSPGGSANTAPQLLMVNSQLALGKIEITLLILALAGNWFVLLWPIIHKTGSNPQPPESTLETLLKHGL